MTDVPPQQGPESWSTPPGSPPPPPGPPPMPPPAGVPVGAAAGAHEYADFGKRAIAGLIDFIAPGIVAGIIFQVSTSLGFIVWLASMAWILYNAYLNGSTGQSIGKKQVGIRLVKESDGSLIGGGLGIARYFAHLVDAVICYIGFLFPLWDAKRQTIADKIMGTVVVVENGAAFRGV